MSFRAAPQYVLIMECPLDILPVPNKICPAVFYRAVAPFTVVLDPGQELFGCQKLIFINILIEPSFCDPFFIQRIPGYPVDVFHQMKSVCHKSAFPYIVGSRTDPAPSIAVDINTLQHILVIMLTDISIYGFPQGEIGRASCRERGYMWG